VVLVPTMGALHRGHAALIERARALAGREGLVVVSIFVNPAQFGPKEDFARYPRPFAADRKLCAAHGADVIFHPTPDAMYPAGFSAFVDESGVSARLCGASRPGLGLRLITLHNLHFYLGLMACMRQEIEAGTFAAFRREFVAGYGTNAESAEPT